MTSATAAHVSGAHQHSSILSVPCFGDCVALWVPPGTAGLPPELSLALPTHPLHRVWLQPTELFCGMFGFAELLPVQPASEAGSLQTAHQPPASTGAPPPGRRPRTQFTHRRGGDCTFMGSPAVWTTRLPRFTPSGDKNVQKGLGAWKV